MLRHCRIRVAIFLRLLSGICNKGTNDCLKHYLKTTLLRHCCVAVMINIGSYLANFVPMQSYCYIVLTLLRCCSDAVDGYLNIRNSVPSLILVFSGSVVSFSLVVQLARVRSPPLPSPFFFSCDVISRWRPLSDQASTTTMSRHCSFAGSKGLT